MAKDVVCGMDVDEQEAKAQGLTSEYQGQTYYFCGAGCKRSFDRNPTEYLNQQSAEQQ